MIYRFEVFYEIDKPIPNDIYTEAWYNLIRGVGYLDLQKDGTYKTNSHNGIVAIYI